MHTFAGRGRKGRSNGERVCNVIIIYLFVCLLQRGRDEGKEERDNIDREIREKWETKITAKEIEDLFKQRSLSIC